MYIPPSVLESDTSSDTIVDERQKLSLRCRASGYPTPSVTWRREDGKDINQGLYGGKKFFAAKVDGEYLNITQVTREDMGAYLCISSNGVPPIRPKIKVQNQLVGAPVSTDVQLECRCEASPKPLTSWIRSDGWCLASQSNVSKIGAKLIPSFAEPMANVSISTGRNTMLECTIDNLAEYKVAWLKMDKNSEPTLLTIHTQSLIQDNRFRVSHNNHRQWYLHINNVQISDKGFYMCQINAEQMQSQVGYLDVLVPPSVLESDTSSDTIVDERQKLSLRCRASGYPTPSVTWRREDGKDINQGLYGGKKFFAAKVDGEYLNITQVTREDMGAYLCISSNGVPPSDSTFWRLDVLAQLFSAEQSRDCGDNNLERDLGAELSPKYLLMAVKAILRPAALLWISRSVPVYTPLSGVALQSSTRHIQTNTTHKLSYTIRPKIKVQNQLVGAPVSTDVQLECRCEASPKPLTSWIRSDG
ncbi:unnamed protein product, partial [Medioppia subpectinata]